MADPSLDDFFAKKDKSKKKSKSKKITAGDLMPAQKVDENAPIEGEVKEVKKEKKKKKENDENTNSSRRKEDSEWHDYEEEESTDYSGLRIQNLQISKEEEVEDDGDDDDDYEEGSDGERREKDTGPWKKTQTIQSTPALPSAAEPPMPKLDDIVTPSGRYVPPAARLAASQGVQMPRNTTGPTPRRGPRSAPSLNSAVEFPTLGGSMQDTAKLKDYGPNRFEEVKTGNRQLTDTKGQVKLELGNKFSALSKND